MIPPNPFSHKNTDGTDGRILKYHGEEVYLAGRYPNIGDLPDVNYDVLLRKLSVQRNNFFRHWMTAYWNYSLPGNHHSPFARPGGKWNLTAYNPDYFVRLDRMIRAALHHGIVVQLTLFDVPGLKNISPDRWAKNPWNSVNNSNGFIAAPDGVVPFYDLGHVGLRTAQKAFVDKVVGATMMYPNVFYEIINEGSGGGDAERPTRVRWFDAVTGWIYDKTKAAEGGRLIFHNDYVANGQSAADVIFWKSQQHLPQYANYSKLDGVILHGDPRNVLPSATRYKDIQDLVFQVSTDAYDDRTTPEDDRDTFEWNEAVVPVLFARKMIYQAEAAFPDTGRAIGQAAPSPTDLRLGRFTHLFRGGAAGQTPFQRRFFVDGGLGFYIDYAVAGTGEVGRGRVVDFQFDGTDQQISLRPDGAAAATWWRFGFTANGATLTLDSLGTEPTLVMNRVPRAPLSQVIPFLYNWERIDNTGAALAVDFEIRFDVDGALRLFRRAGDEEIDHLEVRAVDATTLTLGRLRNGTTQTLRYTFGKRGSGLRTLELVNTANNARQLFEERAWYIPTTVTRVPASATAATTAAAEPALV
ncbi:MAG TPA: hypothetical protein VEX86_22720 [Longimicrobium sp.]|nr:hypothetical protein [Longimicrobium sp.]